MRFNASPEQQEAFRTTVDQLLTVGFGPNTFDMNLCELPRVP